MVNFHLHFVEVYYTIKVIMSCCKKQGAYSHSHWCIYLIFLYFVFDIRLWTRTLPELSKNGPQIERGYQSPFPPDRPGLRSGSDLITLLLPEKIKCYTFSEVMLGLRPVREFSSKIVPWAIEVGPSSSGVPSFHFLRKKPWERGWISSSETIMSPWEN